MEQKIAQIENKIDCMKNVLDVKSMVDLYNEISTELNTIKTQLAETEKYVISIEDPYAITTDDTYILDISENSDDSDDSVTSNKVVYTNDKYLEDIDDLRNVEKKILSEDLNLNDMMDLYEKSYMIMQDIIQFLDNQKLNIINVD